MSKDLDTKSTPSTAEPTPVTPIKPINPFFTVVNGFSLIFSSALGVSMIILIVNAVSSL